MQIRAKIASTPSQREIGFQGIKEIKNDEGIYFVFSSSQKLSFWMLNTPVPLDIAFVNKNNRINQISQLNPYSTRVVTSEHESQYALEVKQGTFKQNGIQVGDIIEIEGNDYIQASKISDMFKNIFIRKKEKGMEEDEDNISEEENDEFKNDVQQNIEEKKEDLEDAKEEMHENSTRGEDEILPVEMEPYQDQEAEGRFENEARENIQDKQVEFPDSDPLNVNATIQEILDYADIHGLNLKLLYRNAHGTILPPKILSPVDNKEYLFFKGDNGSYFKAFDNCATVYGKDWIIEGQKIKSFLYSRIIDLEIIM